MPDQHHGDPGMHMVNEGWHYFNIHHWATWLFIAILIFGVYFVVKSILNNKKK